MAVNTVAGQAAGGMQVNGANRTSKKDEVSLSKTAQSYLQELKKKYSDMDFFVAAYSTDEEAQEYLKQGTKKYSVVIHPDTLEAMATDEETRKKYEGILSNAGAQFDQIKQELGEDADKLENLGMTVDKDGAVKYVAELNMGIAGKNYIERSADTADRAQEKKAQEKKAQEKKAESKEAEQQKETRKIEADSVEQLISKIREALIQERTNNVRTEEEKAKGQSIDFTV